MCNCGNRRFLGLTSCLCFGLCLGLLAACGERNVGVNSNASQDAAVDTAVDAAVDAEPDAGPLDSISVVVKAYSSADGTFMPTSGATVAFDAPGGVRTEVTTGADGRAIFGGIDWTAGDAAITSYVPDVGLNSLVNVDQARVASLVDENGDVPCYPSWYTYVWPETVTISGSATGLADLAHTYTVHAVQPPYYFHFGDSGSGDSEFNIFAPSGEPFVLLAFESDFTELPSGRGYDRPIYNVMHQDYGPITEDATGVVLDFGAHGIATHSADVSILLPPRAASPLHTGDGIPECSYCANDLTSCRGWPTYLDVVDNNSRVDVSFLWVEPAWAPSSSWKCGIVGAHGEGARIYVRGTPVHGSQEQFMDSPTWVTPSDPQVASPLHDPIEWQNYEDADSTIVWVFGLNGYGDWTMSAGPNATTATFPQAPSTVDEVQLLGWLDILMNISVLDVDSEGRVWRRARSRAADVSL